MLNMLSLLTTLALLGATAADNSTCADVYYPPTLQQGEDKYSLATFGLTGAGKSTLIDELAGGHYLSPVGGESGDSQTEQACTFHFDWLGRSAERWAVLDTPGFDDTGGARHDITNNDLVETALRKMGKVHAVLLVWRFDEKNTPTNLGAFLALRSVFDASIWQHMVVVYTHWHWEEFSRYTGWTCTSKSDLATVHQRTMDVVFKYINGLAGDVKCNSSINKKCFPEARNIPFIGSDLKMDDLVSVRNFPGCDLLNPAVNDSRCSSQCPVDSAGQIRSIRSILGNMTDTAGYQPLDTRNVTNYWTSCYRCRSNLQLILDGFANDTIVRDAALKLQECMQGGITVEVQKAAVLLQNRSDLQARLAFFMTEPQFIAPPCFSTKVAHIVMHYPSFHVYTSCRAAADGNNQNVAMLSHKVMICWGGLADIAGQPRAAKYHSSIKFLLTSYRSRDFKLRMAVALDMLRYCDDDHDDVESLRCPVDEVVQRMVSVEEWHEVSLWKAFVSNGRCCATDSANWAARAGVCDNRGVRFNQTSIDCLRYCPIDALEMPSSCQKVQQHGQVMCHLKDIQGQQHTVKGNFHTSEPIDAYIRNDQSVALLFDLQDEVSFVMSNSMQQEATCHEGGWKITRPWVLPSARQIRSCRVCQMKTQCLKSHCSPGKGLQDALWLAGAAEDSDLCLDPQVCGEQHDSSCDGRPQCPMDDGHFTDGQECSTTSCGVNDCCVFLQIKYVEDTWDWCPQHAGTKYVEFWPVFNDGTEGTTKKKVYVGTMMEWKLHAAAEWLKWQCDGNSDIGRSRLQSSRFWKIELTAEHDWLHDLSGRLHLFSYLIEAETTSVAEIASPYAINSLTFTTISAITMIIIATSALVRCSCSTHDSDNQWTLLMDE